MLPAGTSAWGAAEAWAMNAPQRAILEALDQVTGEENPIEAYAFGQPYGADAAAASPDGIDLIKANLYTDLGDPPMLAGAKFLYLPALDKLACLVHVEATRLGAAGKPDEAMRVLKNWIFFARQIADRQFFAESRWGLRQMIVSFDRVRDIAYQDARSGKHVLTSDQIAKVLDRLKGDGFLRLDRLLFPGGNRIAAEQVVAQVFTPKNGPNATFGQSMARLASTQRPLRLFAEAARWDKVAQGHANATVTGDELKVVYNDLTARWSWDPWDSRRTLKSDYEKMMEPGVAPRYAVLGAVVPDMTMLYNDREVLRTQLIGTRDALAVLAFAFDSRNFPPTLASVRPRYVKALEADPFNPNRANGEQPPLEYFVPGRSGSGGSEGGTHEMNVILGGGESNFQVQVGGDQFILYSVGPNGTKDFARNVSGEPAKGAIGDLLLWPPVISLTRQNMIETDRLK
jgi:hypothetical protein